MSKSRMSKSLSVTVIFLAVLVFASVFVQGPIVSGYNVPESNTVSFPIAFTFSIRIDPSNNYWYANVTNVGESSLSQFGVLLFNSSGYEITANSTVLAGVNSLKPGGSMHFRTVCSDYYYSGAPCRFKSGDSYGLSIVSWIGTCSCDKEIQVSGEIEATNKVYSLASFPSIAVVTSSSVTTTKWSMLIRNEGTKTVTLTSEINWVWQPCNNPSGCFGSKSMDAIIIGSASSMSVSASITKPHEASKGTDASVSISANYKGIWYSGWSAELTMTQNVVVS
jgi:hypothetical protein